MLNLKKLRHYGNFGIQVASWQFDSIRRAAGYQIIHCLGDSHINMFRYLSKQKYLKKTIFRCLEVGGATAMGMVNPNSKTNALNVFRKYLRFVPRNNHLLFMLGEVDCGFVIWYRATKYGTSVQTQFEQSLANYQNFISSLIVDGYQKIIVCSTPPPTIDNGQTWGEVANARREVTATLHERTVLTQYYNSKLRQFCMEKRLKIIDIEPELLNQSAGVVNRKFLNRNPLDHHLESSTVAPILKVKLQQIGFQ